MHETHFQQVDLNLLHILQALLEERHVTRAAKRCFLSQSAMSRAFERLREMFKDDLLIRTGRSGNAGDPRYRPDPHNPSKTCSKYSDNARALDSKTSDGDPQFPVPDGLASEAYW
jgi:hypothetical protein